ncbi:TetR/AcrR family transcriptional regulator [Rhodococcus sp. NPDC058514]|uniref:TetR/AcrR family transcriptional regulator n=1 Tax=unclassified Rhodococcus (in: high G+C Gram-positive bacteria) TaxID=192944 RepID=UPI00365691EA
MRESDWLTGGNRRAIAVERIHAAAAELFLERGLDQVSVEDVAARAGCSRATLYRYVGGKSALVDGVVAAAAAAVAQQVAVAVTPLDGDRRIVEAILVSVAAVRADAALSRWVTTARAGRGDDYLASSPELGRVATALTGIAPDAEAAQWIVRVVISLLTVPAGDPAMERRMVERFVAPAFR